MIMNFKTLILTGVVAATMVSCGTSYKSQTKIETRADSVAYLMGATDGQRQKQTYEHFGLDTLLDFDTYFEALYRASNELSLKYTLDSAGQITLNSFRFTQTRFSPTPPATFRGWHSPKATPTRSAICLEPLTAPASERVTPSRA